ncbi:MAG: hypothetical protein NUW24_00800 [Anaerolineae bacterium]|nr:hypothetical protein [Anaerolineae bacterium]MDH7475607.1 hypothetical protein [Anaerolineae bacterium]
MALALPGCNPIKREDPRLDFTKILPEGLQAQQVERLDTDSDGRLDWVLFYRYKAPGAQADQLSPIAAAVYHAEMPKDGKQLPEIVPYSLNPPDGRYLGENPCQARMADVITKNKGLEVVIESVNADGLVTDAAIFTWRGSKSAEETLPGYRCLGVFHAHGHIAINTDEVVVKEYAEDRSQLAVRRVYRPQNGTYLNEYDQLYPSIERNLEFAAGKPKDVAASPHPESIILAFYEDLNTDTALDYLSKSGRERLRRNELDLGAPWPRNRIKKALVLELRYDRSNTGKPETEVGVRVYFESVASEKSEIAELIWTCVQEDGFWKMDRSRRASEK